MFPQIAKRRFSWNFPPKGFRSDRVRVVSFERLFRKKSSTRNSLPETNSSHLRMDGWKTTFFLSGANCLFLWSVIDNCALRSWNSRIFGTTKRLCPIVHRGSKCGPVRCFSVRPNTGDRKFLPATGLAIEEVVPGWMDSLRFVWVGCTPR